MKKKHKNDDDDLVEKLIFHLLNKCRTNTTFIS